jgi:hypothetical protein
MKGVCNGGVLAGCDESALRGAAMVVTVAPTP